MIWPSKITTFQKGIAIYSSLLIFIIHHYCGMFSNPRRVSVSNMDTLRCTQQAHAKISEKFKICSKSHYFTVWAKKCATCVHIKKYFFVSSIHTSCLPKSILVPREHIPAELWSLEVQKCPKNDLKKKFHIYTLQIPVSNTSINFYAQNLFLKAINLPQSLMLPKFRKNQ